MSNNNPFRRFLVRLLDVAVVADLISIIVAAITLVQFQLNPPASANFGDMFRAILAVLFLIAVAGLWDRFRRLGSIGEAAERSRQLLEEFNITVRQDIESIKSSLDQKVINRVRAEELFDPSTKPTTELFSAAQEVLISGITLGNTIHEFSHVLTQRVNDGANVKVLVVDAEKGVLQQLVARSYGNPTIEHYTSRLKNTRQLISFMIANNRPKGSLDLGQLPFVPSFGVIMVDPSETNGQAIVEMYHHSIDKPGLRFRLSASSDPFWFAFFKEQFELMWQKSKKTALVTKRLADDGDGATEDDTAESPGTGLPTPPNALTVD